MNDGGRPIKNYVVEMYDLPTGNWVMVTQTQGPDCRSMLDNILCGIMYRFRIRAVNEVGSSVPGIPSDSFVIDTPGVHIAPYFILCPPPEVFKCAHETIQFRAKALGTPTPNILWQKDHEPIFITQGIDIEEEPDGSLLTVHNLQLDDDGIIECVAVNHVGKATATTRLQVICAPKFQTLNIPLQFSFRNEDMIRLKFPMEVQPEPLLTLLKDDIHQSENAHCQTLFRDNNVILKIDSAQEKDTGSYKIDADNGFGKTSVQFSISVEVPPLTPSTPEILDITPTGVLTLAWQPPPGSPVDHYIVEYYRDQWQLWLRMKTCIDNVTVMSDLIPGSKYKFRVMAASISGISEPSEESEEIMIGKPAEDELFDLPSSSRGSRGRNMFKKTRKVPSFDRASLDRSMGGRVYQPTAANRRHTSLDREVYYDANNVRRDVVTYKPPELDKEIGELAHKYKMSNEEIAKYRMSMSELCHKMKAISTTSISSRAGSKVSLDTATKPLQMEITNQARKSNSLGQLWSAPHIERMYTDKLQFQTKSSSSTFLAQRNKLLDQSFKTPSRPEITNDIKDCKQSLTDIRDRIGSLQSLLKTSRSLTTSKQKLFADLPSFNVPDLDKKTMSLREEEACKKFVAHRNNSYANAIESNPVVEEHYQETHFPYNPELASLGSLECDKFKQHTDRAEGNLQQELQIQTFLTETGENSEGGDLVNETVTNFLAPLTPSKFDGLNEENDQIQESSSYRNIFESPITGRSNSPDDRTDTSFTLKEGTDTSMSLHERTMSSCSTATLMGGPASEEELLSESTQTLPADRSMSSCSQGTLVADSTSIDLDSDSLDIALD